MGRQTDFLFHVYARNIQNVTIWDLEKADSWLPKWWGGGVLWKEGGSILNHDKKVFTVFIWNLNDSLPKRSTVPFIVTNYLTLKS